MFDRIRTEKEVSAARKMEGLYHKGQTKAWDGKTVLEGLIEEHGGIHLDPEQLEPLKRIFAVIFWGELAAWKVAAELALELEPLEAKMAAVSQAHDEARHFYVLHDYLSILKYEPAPLPDSAHQIINQILGANNLAKKIMGMQLMVEPIALTLFQLVRHRKLEPVLSGLLEYYERDEARHVALGVNFLPQLLRRKGPLELADFYSWQLRMFMIQLQGVKEMEEDFRALGFTPQEAIRTGEVKQLQAARLVSAQLPPGFPVEELVTRFIEFRIALDFSEVEESRRARWQQAIRALILNNERTRDIQNELDALSPTRAA